MRALCTVSAPLLACAPPPPLEAPTGSVPRPLPPGARFLALHLLGGTTLYFIVEAKSRVREVFAQTCLHFASHGMLDTELFGLAIICDGEYLFADPESKLSKYGPKSWRSSHTHGLDANGKPLLELYFRVQFYVESPLVFRDDVTRNHYFLQLKDNASRRDHGASAASEQALLVLGGLALQACHGDVSEDLVDYFTPEEYAPQGLRNAWGVQALQACHRDNTGLSKADAELMYLRDASSLQDTVNCHLFRMRANKAEMGHGSVWLSVCPKGIRVAPEHGTASSFSWPSIGKLSFDRKKFEIRSGDNKLTLYAGSDDKSKLLLALCRETHQFSMKIAPRLNEAIKREEEERKCLRDCYMYSRALNLPYKSKSDQRISVISSTSSNTTSGIVSDRVHSEDELEIMINSPPAPSTESLAFAHLLDCSRSHTGSVSRHSSSIRPGVSRQASSVGQVSLKDLEDTLAALTIRKEAEAKHFAARSVSSTSSETIDRAGHGDRMECQPIKCTGSQCSSSCSTVVVTELAPVAISVKIAPRRSSTTSSLELGYSHTAQNSASCIELDYSAHPVANSVIADSVIADSVSDVYTIQQTATVACSSETSGVYTMGSSEMTGQSSEIADSDVTHSESRESLDYGSFRPQNDGQSIASASYRTDSPGADSNYMEQKRESSEGVDTVDAAEFRHRMGSDATVFRQRSDSNISACGSFHGDGSDPTDKKHVLLSAEELSDLIVGRGTYPSRKTVSHTLDSDCDYVTLPLPLDGDSYLQGHEDTAPCEEIYPELDDEYLQTPPTPPMRTDSNKEPYVPDITAVKSCIKTEMFPMSPPPYPKSNETYERKISKVDTMCELQGAALGIPLRDPPPYPSGTAAPPQPPMYPEEATARFITTRPHINILTAHTTIVNAAAEPSYSAPAVTNVSSPVPVTVHMSMPMAPNIGIPIVPYTLSSRPSHVSYTNSLPHYQVSRPPPPSYPEHSAAGILQQGYLEVPQKPSYPTAVLVPVVKQRQYLPPPPPPIIPRQPPPPPPTLATVYTSQVARSQIEQYQQQLYSDVDYVIYPLQDPAISKQEYLDSKQGSLLAAMAHSPPPPPPPYPAYPKSHVMYRSTPYLPVSFSTHARYASTQNLSDTYVQLPAGYSPLYSPASYSSSTHSLRYEPPPPPPLRSLPRTNLTHFSRTRSDDNILNSIEAAQTKYRRLPPPPPPYEHKKRPPKPPMPAPVEPSQSSKAPAGDGPIDIRTLREKSKNLDLPLISALCNDRSLLKQTKAFVMPKHPSLLSPSKGSSKLKYPVSGLSSTQLNKPPRRTAASHRHPNDKLPALPGHAPDNTHLPRTTTTGNNYVINGPGSAPSPKHKSVHSQS